MLNRPVPLCSPVYLRPEPPGGPADLLDLVFPAGHEMVWRITRFPRPGAPGDQISGLIRGLPGPPSLGVNLCGPVGVSPGYHGGDPGNAPLAVGARDRRGRRAELEGHPGGRGSADPGGLGHMVTPSHGLSSLPAAALVAHLDDVG